MYQYILKNYRNIQLLSDFTNSAYVTALQKVNLNEKKRKSRTIVTYMYVKKWEDNMNSKIDRVKCIIRWQKTLSDDIPYTYNLEMILMRTWRKSWELEKWRSRSPLGGNDWNVRGPWWPILSVCGGRAERDTWHHTLCPPVCKTAEKILYCNEHRNSLQKYVLLTESVDLSEIPVPHDQAYFSKRGINMKRYNEYYWFLYTCIHIGIFISSLNCILWRRSEVRG